MLLLAFCFFKSGHKELAACKQSATVDSQLLSMYIKYIQMCKCKECMAKLVMSFKLMALPKCSNTNQSALLSTIHSITQHYKQTVISMANERLACAANRTVEGSCVVPASAGRCVRP